MDAAIGQLVWPRCRLQGYLSDGLGGAARLQVVDDVAMGTNELMPSEMPLVNFTHLVVYTQSSLVEQTTPASFVFNDIESRVTNITFSDHDLEFDGIGGVVSWAEPFDARQVTHYILYMAVDGNGTNRSYVGLAMLPGRRQKAAY